jgi:hypothetical protein
MQADPASTSFGEGIWSDGSLVPSGLVERVPEPCIPKPRHRLGGQSLDFLFVSLIGAWQFSIRQGHMQLVGAEA